VELEYVEKKFVVVTLVLRYETVDPVVILPSRSKDIVKVDEETNVDKVEE
jgi:hypothetical protein